MKKVAVALLALAALTGCSPSQQLEPAPLEPIEVEQVLSDGRTVTCLSFLGGLSCDWESVK